MLVFLRRRDPCYELGQLLSRPLDRPREGTPERFRPGHPFIRCNFYFVFFLLDLGCLELEQEWLNLDVLRFLGIKRSTYLNSYLGEEVILSVEGVIYFPIEISHPQIKITTGIGLLRFLNRLVLCKGDAYPTQSLAL